MQTNYAPQHNCYAGLRVCNPVFLKICRCFQSIRKGIKPQELGGMIRAEQKNADGREHNICGNRQTFSNRCGIKNGFRQKAAGFFYCGRPQVWNDSPELLPSDAPGYLHGQEGNAFLRRGFAFWHQLLSP